MSAEEIKRIQEEQGCSLQEARRIYKREVLRSQLRMLKDNVSQPTSIFGLQVATIQLIKIVEEIVDGND